MKNIKLVIFCLLLFLSIKLFYISYIYFYEVFHNHLELGFGQWFDLISNIDSYNRYFGNFDNRWYKGIVDHWYKPLTKPEYIYTTPEGELTQTEWAFFPLFPICVIFIKQLFNLKTLDAFFLSNVLMCTGLYFQLITYFKNKKWTEKQSIIIFCLIIFSQFSFYFQCYYSESLFLFLFLLIINGLMQGKITQASIAACFLTLTRPNGIFILPLFLLFDIESEFSISIILNKVLENLRKIWIILVSGTVSFIAWSYYQFLSTGDFFAFMSAQKGWAKKTMFPLFVLFSEGNIYHQYHSIHVIIFIILSFLFFWKKEKIKFHELSINMMGVLLPMASGKLMSLPRFMSVLIYFHQELGLRIAKLPNIKIIIILLIFLVLHLLSFNFWLSENFFAV